MTRDESASEKSSEEAGSDALSSDLKRAARELAARLARQNEMSREPGFLGRNSFHNDLEDDVFEDDEAALRWRHALLRLSETFLDAAEERRDLSPILLGALHNALEQLLIHGEEADLMALEDWLSHEAQPSTPDSERRTSDFLMAGESGIYNGAERRSGTDRRSQNERRQADRRS